MAKFFLILLSMCSSAQAEPTKVISNPYTGRFDYITKMDTTTILATGLDSIFVTTGTPQGISASKTFVSPSSLTLRGGMMCGSVTNNITCDSSGYLQQNGVGGLSLSASQWFGNATRAGFPNSGIWFDGPTASIQNFDLAGAVSQQWSQAAGTSFVRDQLVVGNNAALGTGFETRGPGTTDATFSIIAYNNDISKSALFSDGGKMLINTLSSTKELDVNGHANIEYGLQVGSVSVESGITASSGTFTSGQLLVSPDTLYVNGGRVGINTTSPSTDFDSRGISNFGAALGAQTQITSDGSIDMANKADINGDQTIITMPASSEINMTGANSYITSVTSITTTGSFFGDGSHLTGLPGGAGEGATYSASTKTFTQSLQVGGVGQANPPTTLNVDGSAQFGSGATKSTFSTTGALTMASGASIVQSGSGGFFTNKSSVNASAFFGDGSQLTGIAAGSEANTFYSSKTFTDSVEVSKLGGYFLADGTATIVGNAFSVGLSSFVVVGSSIGIRTTSPQTALDVNGSVQIGIGVNKSTFSVTGALTLANNAAIVLSGASGNYTSGSSVTASAFFGNGSQLTGITAAPSPESQTMTSSKTFTTSVALAVESGAVSVGTRGVVNDGFIFTSSGGVVFQSTTTNNFTPIFEVRSNTGTTVYQLNRRGDIIMGTKKVTENPAITVWFNNESSATMTQGMIVALTTAARRSNAVNTVVIAATTTVIGTVFDLSCLRDTPCRIAVGGVALVRNNATAVSAGRHCQTSTTRGLAQAAAAPAASSSIGIWLENVVASGIGRVLLMR